MSSKEEIHVAYELPNGIKVMITGKVKDLLEKYKLNPAELWKIKDTVGLCIEDIKCTGKCIQIMGSVNLGASVQVLADLSIADDIWCVCPENNCRGLIRVVEQGIALKNPAVFISLKEIINKIPKESRKSFVEMTNAMLKEE